MPLNFQPLTWRETKARIRADRRRLEQMLEETHGHRPPFLWLNPQFMAVLLYRLSNHQYRRGRRYTARLLWHLNFFLTGADISEPADIGEGLLIMAPVGVALMGTAGRNLTVMPCAGMGAEVGRRDDIGAGPGFPLLGDDVVLEPHSGVLGPARIGDRVRIPAGIAVTRDVEDDTLLTGPKTKAFRRQELA